ncbi:amidase family protein (plasmid) [Paraburkholderia strydomiana]
MMHTTNNPSYTLLEALQQIAMEGGSTAAIERLTACAAHVGSIKSRTVEPQGTHERFIPKSGYISEITATLVRAQADRWRCISRVTTERALDRAGELDTLRDGTSLPLAGVPYVAKSAFKVTGTPLLAGGPDVGLSDVLAALEDAALVQRLDAAGAVLVGVAQMDEYAYGFLGDNPHYGAVINPTDSSAYSGGSSSGSAAAVAAGIVPFAIGTDTNGSVRVPAAFCGVFSLKPTYGLLPLDGCLPLAESLDHAGIIASSLSILERVWFALDVSATRTGATASTKLGFAAEAYRRLCNDRVRSAFAAVRAACKDAVDVELPDIQLSLATASIITTFEALRNHGEILDSHPQRYSAAITQRLRAAEKITLCEYEAALSMMRDIRSKVLAQFERHEVGVLVVPVTPVDRIEIGQHYFELDGITLAAADVAGLFTRPFSLAGLPVLTIPRRLSIECSGPAVALQLIALPGEELRLFALARELAEYRF